VKVEVNPGSSEKSTRLDFRSLKRMGRALLTGGSRPLLIGAERAQVTNGVQEKNGWTNGGPDFQNSLPGKR